MSNVRKQFAFAGRRAKMEPMKTLAVANHKGGVGKTATAHALGEILAHEHHQRVLLVDIDPQASLTMAAGVEDAAGRCLVEVFGGARPGKTPLAAILRDLGGGLWLAPSDITLADTELALGGRLGREIVLQQMLATVAGDYDLCIIDCPPSRGLLTINALVAAQGVLIPAQPTVVDLRALRSFLNSVGQVHDALNKDLEVLGVLPTFYDSRLGHHALALDELGRAGVPVFDVRIGRSIRVAEAAATGASVSSYAPDHPQTENYRLLAKVVTKWLRKN